MASKISDITRNFVSDMANRILNELNTEGNGSLVQEDSQNTKEDIALQDTYQDIIYLHVPYEDKDKVKALGAWYDADEKKWFIRRDQLSQVFDPWLRAQPVSFQYNLELAVAEFKTKIIEQGLVLEGMPIMDGNIHRVPVQGEQGYGKSGAYKGFLDGVPAGFIQNFKTGTKISWKTAQKPQKNVLNGIVNNSTVISQGERLAKYTVQDTAQGQSQNATVSYGIDSHQGHDLSLNLSIQDHVQKQQELMQAQREHDYEIAARYLQEEYQNALIMPNIHPYLLKKGFDNNFFAKDSFLNKTAKLGDFHNLFKVDSRGNLLFALRDVEGKHWSSQRIFATGSKFIGVLRTPEQKEYGINFSSKKKGTFVVFGRPLSECSHIYLTEGMATALTVAQAMATTTVACVDVGNMAEVVAKIKGKYPNLAITICADNDYKNVKSTGKNIGIETAIKLCYSFDKVSYVAPIVKKHSDKLSDNDNKDTATQGASAISIEVSDFNDVFVKAHSLQAVRDEITMQESLRDKGCNYFLALGDVRITEQNGKTYYEFNATDAHYSHYRVVSLDKKLFENVKKDTMYLVEGKVYLSEHKTGQGNNGSLANTSQLSSQEPRSSHSHSQSHQAQDYTLFVKATDIKPVKTQDMSKEVSSLVANARENQSLSQSQSQSQGLGLER